ncbi:MAG: sensor domain-containing diguanylate cyclase, partial [Candidatus Omnitrophota bacterium]
ELMLSASHGSSRVKAKQGDMLDHWVLRHRKSLIIEDIMKDFRFPLHDEDVSKETFCSMISAPLVSENKVIGVLRMDSPAEAAYTQDDLRLLDILSYLGALAVQNSYLYSRTQELATKDSLTGLAVRRYFTERLKEEIKRAARRGTKLAVLMLDIDRFKDYNDRYGHLSGDLVLKHLSNIVSRLARKGDVVARYGGEEFVILMLDRDKADALAEAEEIRKKIKDSPLKLRRQDANITVSIGVSSYPEDAGLVEELVRIADDRLYRAKAGGGDKVC